MNRRDHIEAEHYDATHGETFDGDCPSWREAANDERRSDPTLDPLWHIADLTGRGFEELARLAYGDATVDAALARVTEEEGF